MALGDTFTAYIQEAYLQTVRNNIFWNSWVFNGPFEVVGPAQCPGGASIDFLIDYATSTNAATYTVGTPMPEPDSLSSIRAYFNKDYYQTSAKVYGITLSQQKVNYDGQVVNMDPTTKAIDNAANNLKDLISTTCYTDLATQVDSATAFSDASLTRATYSIAASETAVSGALTLAALEDRIEELENVTYGVVPREDIVILMPRNQLTNLSRLQTGAQYFEFNASSQDMGPVDAGRTMRTQTFEGCDILVVPDMTTTEILLVRKSAVKVFVHRDLEITPKDVDEDAFAYHLKMGVNMVNTDPKRCCKLTGVTA